MLAFAVVPLMQDATVAPAAAPNRPMSAELRLPTGAIGGVKLRCLAQPDGQITDCRIMQEMPEGEGFGQAAVVLSRRSRISPRTVAGRTEPTEFEYNTYFNEDVDLSTISDLTPSPSRP